jgi:hypothetical protein
MPYCITLCPRPIFKSSACLSNLTSSDKHRDLSIPMLQKSILNPDRPGFIGSLLGKQLRTYLCRRSKLHGLLPGPISNSDISRVSRMTTTHQKATTRADDPTTSRPDCAQRTFPHAAEVTHAIAPLPCSEIPPWLGRRSGWNCRILARPETYILVIARSLGDYLR